MENISGEQLKQYQLEGKKMLVDLYATWCGPCKQLIPKLESLEKDYKDILFVKMDVDQNMDDALDMGIRSVPTVIIFDGEKIINRSSGVNQDSHYKEFLDQL
jgi:thioredoxin